MRVRGLESYYLSPGVPKDDDYASTMSNFPFFRKLGLGSLSSFQTAPISDEGVAHLTRLRGLQTLSLQRCRNLSVASAHVIAGLTSLQSLHIHETFDNQVALLPLGGLRKLQYLSIHSAPVTDAILETILVANPQLQTLIVNHTTVLTSLHALAHVPFLERLNVSRCYALNDVAIAPVTALRSLTSLNIAKTHITGIGLQGARCVNTLTELEFSEGYSSDCASELTLEGAKVLAQLTKYVTWLQSHSFLYFIS